MKYIYMTGNLIWKNKNTFLLLFLQLLLSMLILLSLVGRVQNIMSTKKMVNVFSDDNAYYFSLYSYYTPEKGVEELVREQIKEPCQICSITELQLQEMNGAKVEIYGYNDNLIDHSSLELQSGHWFSEEKKTDRIPLIALTGAYKTGEILNFSGENGKTLQAEVIGTMSRDAYIMTFNSYGSSGNSSLDEFISRPYCDFIAPMESGEWSSFSREDSKGSTEEVSTILIFEKPQAEGSVSKALSDYGVTSSITEMKKNYTRENTRFFITNGIVLLVFLLLTAAGIGGINCMLYIKNQKRYVIWYMLGLTNRQCAWIEVLRGGSLLAFSYGVLLLLYRFTKIQNWFDVTKYEINSVTFLIILLFVALIFFITSYPYIRKLDRTELIRSYQQEN